VEGGREGKGPGGREISADVTTRLRPSIGGGGGLESKEPPPIRRREGRTDEAGRDDGWMISFFFSWMGGRSNKHSKQASTCSILASVGRRAKTYSILSFMGRFNRFVLQQKGVFFSFDFRKINGRTKNFFEKYTSTAAVPLPPCHVVVVRTFLFFLKKSILKHF
jgi:hypothetical protein